MEIHIQKRIHVSVSQSSQNQFCGRGPVGISLPKTTLQNHSRQMLFPASTREQRSTYAFLHKTFSVAKAS